MATPALDLTRNITRPAHATPRAGLVVGEVRQLSNAPPMPSPSEGVLTRLRHSHHKLARCLAEGMRVFEASAATGYAAGTICSLKADPTFKALVAHYQEVQVAAFADAAERMATLSADAIEVLQERVATDPDAVSTEVLLKLATAMLDRTGHAPIVKAQVAHVSYNHSELEGLRAQARAGVTVLPARGVALEGAPPAQLPTPDLVDALCATDSQSGT